MGDAPGAGRRCKTSIVDVCAPTALLANVRVGNETFYVIGECFEIAGGQKQSGSLFEIA
jgi:hypothetical protein